MLKVESSNSQQIAGYPADVRTIEARFNCKNRTARTRLLRGCATNCASTGSAGTRRSPIPRPSANPPLRRLRNAFPESRVKRRCLPITRAGPLAIADTECTRGTAMAKALMAWPEGKENWSGGSTFDQQCDSSWHGRFLLLAFLMKRNRTTVAASAVAAGGESDEPHSPPNSSRAIPTEYQIQPSPNRVDAIIQIAKPSRRAPAVHFPHDLMIAGLYELPDHSWGGHDCTSFGGPSFDTSR